MKKYKHLFGPLMSRRFGRSLGIDLCPMKTCSYDCIFWQPEVREAASKADVVKLSMSVWNQNLFDRINRPPRK